MAVRRARSSEGDPSRGERLVLALGRVGPYLFLPVMIVLAGGVIHSGAPLDSWQFSRYAAHLLAALAAATAATAAILAAVLHRVFHDKAAQWIGAAVAVYGTLAIPVTSVIDGNLAAGVPTLALRFFAHMATAVLLLISIRPPTRFDSHGVLGPTLLGVAAAYVLFGVVWIAPGNPAEWLGNPVSRSAVNVCFFVTGAIWVSRAARCRSIYHLGVGMGVVALSFAHIYRVQFDLHGDSIAFSTLRLSALLVICFTMAVRAHDGLASMRLARDSHEEVLRLIETALGRSEERDHDLRNGVAGLAGAARALQTAQLTNVVQLRKAINVELARLTEMLETQELSTGITRYRVAPVVLNAIALNSSTGMQVSHEVPPSVEAVGSPSTLSRVLVNILGNCAAHAAGSPVHVTVRRRETRVQIVVSDSGPGMPGGEEADLFARGRRGSGSLGQGLGLYICRELLAVEGGSITSLPTQCGCTILVELPVLEADH